MVQYRGHIMPLLIAAELVFGVSSGQGGLGWFIYENKNQLEIPNVFAGLFTVIVIDPCGFTNLIAVSVPAISFSAFMS